MDSKEYARLRVAMLQKIRQLESQGVPSGTVTDLLATLAFALQASYELGRVDGQTNPGPDALLGPGQWIFGQPQGEATARLN